MEEHSKKVWGMVVLVVLVVLVLLIVVELYRDASNLGLLDKKISDSAGANIPGMVTR